MRRALLLIAAGLLLLPLAVLLPAGRQLFRDDPTALAPFVLPGSATLELPRAGEWCLWHHSRDTQAGELFDNPPELPRTLVLSVDRIRGALSNPAGSVAAPKAAESVTAASTSAQPLDTNAESWNAAAAEPVTVATAEPIPLQFNGSASLQVQGRHRVTVACFSAEAGETIRVAGHLEGEPDPNSGLTEPEIDPATSLIDPATSFVGAVGTAPASAGGSAVPRTSDSDPIPLVSDGSGRAVADLGEVPGHSPRRLFSVRPTFLSTLRFHAAEALREALLILAGALVLLISGIWRALKLRAKSRAQVAQAAQVEQSRTTQGQSATAHEQSRAWIPPPPPPDSE